MRVKLDIPRWSMKFKLYCFDKGWKASDVADMTGLSVATISSYWTGKKKPRDKTCDLIRDKTGFDMSEAIYLSNRGEL